MRFAGLWAVAVAVALAGCGASNLCDGVTCLSGQICDTDTGQCKANPMLGGGTGGSGGSGGSAGGGMGGGGVATGGGAGGGVSTGGGSGGGVSTGGGGTGGGAAPSNDTCASPQLIDFDGGTAVDGGVSVSFVADLSAAADDYQGACSTSAGGDLVYQLTLTSTRDVLITEQGGGSDAVLYLGASPCAGATGYTPFRTACSDVGSVNEAETLRLRNVPAGDYFVFVDSYASAHAGTPTVTVTVTAPNLGPPGDLCSAPLPLFADGGSSDQRLGTTADAGDDSSGSCYASGMSAGPEVYFGFTTVAAKRFSASVTAVDAGGLRAELYLVAQSDCSTGVLAVDAGQQACVFASGLDQPARLTIDNLPAGQWLLAVDSHTGAGGTTSAGAFVLDATLGAPASSGANEACASASVVALSAGPYAGTSTVNVLTGTSGGAASDQQLSCAGAAQSGPDLVYRLTTPSIPGNVVVRALAVSDDFLSLQPSVFLELNCGSDAGMSCYAGSSSTLQTSNAAAAFLVIAGNTPVYAWVDTAAASGGPFELELSTASQPANDTCAGAIPISLNTSMAGTTLGAANDYDSNGVIDIGGQNDCYNDFFGADVVYSFTAPANGVYRVRAVPETMFDVSLGVITACAGLGHCLTSHDDAKPSNAENVVFNGIQGTTYFIVVDSFIDDLTNPGTRGGFILSVTQ